MRWLYNDTWYDVSRFTKCKLRFLNICELLSIPEFQRAVNEYQDEFDISDEWIIETVRKIRIVYRSIQNSNSRTKRAYHRLSNVENKYRHLGFDITRLEKQK